MYLSVYMYLFFDSYFKIHGSFRDIQGGNTYFKSCYNTYKFLPITLMWKTVIRAENIGMYSSSLKKKKRKGIQTKSIHNKI